MPRLKGRLCCPPPLAADILCERLLIVLQLGLSNMTKCHMSGVRSHMSGVMCQVSCVRCHVSGVMCQVWVEHSLKIVLINRWGKLESPKKYSCSAHFIVHTTLCTLYCAQKTCTLHTTHYTHTTHTLQNVLHTKQYTLHIKKIFKFALLRY